MSNHSKKTRIDFGRSFNQESHTTAGRSMPAVSVFQNDKQQDFAPEKLQDVGNPVFQQKSFDATDIAIDKDKGLLQGRFILQRKAPDKANEAMTRFNFPQSRNQASNEPHSRPKTEKPFQIQNTAVQRKENKTGLPDQLKEGMENMSGFSLDDVKVHYNSDKPAQLQALAYAQGTEIHIGPGQEKHLPHESWHVVQQKQGRVQPTVQMKGAAVNDNNSLENEADVMGGYAERQRAPLAIKIPYLAPSTYFTTGMPIQLVKFSEDMLQKMRKKVAEKIWMYVSNPGFPHVTILLNAESAEKAKKLKNKGDNSFNVEQARELQLEFEYDEFHVTLGEGPDQHFYYNATTGFPILAEHQNFFHWMNARWHEANAYAQEFLRVNALNVFTVYDLNRIVNANRPQGTVQLPEHADQERAAQESVKAAAAEQKVKEDEKQKRINVQKQKGPLAFTPRQVPRAKSPVKGPRKEEVPNKRPRLKEKEVLDVPTAIPPPKFLEKRDPGDEGGGGLGRGSISLTSS